MSDKIRHSVRKLRSGVHGPVFDNRAFLIPPTIRCNVNMIDKIGCSVTLNL